MIKATKPSNPIFTSALDEFSFQISGDSAMVSIVCAGEEVLSERYYPVLGSISIYDLGTLIADMVRPTVVATFSITITEYQGDTTINTWTSGEITAHYSTVDIDMACQTFCDQFFLTLLDGYKLTRLGHREFLHATGTDSSEATVEAQYYKDGAIATFSFGADATPTRTTGGITTFDVSPDRYHDATRGELFAYAVTVGKRTQQYQIDHSGAIADPVLLFTNSFGCQETFYCLGRKKIAPTFERKSIVIGGKKINYQVKETRTFEGDTGIIPPSMAHLAEDLLRSDEVYLWRDHRQDKEITFTDSKSERTNDADDMAEFTFSYQYAQRIQNVLFKNMGEGRIFDDSFDDTFN